MVQIVIDNAKNYVFVGKILMERHPYIFWTPCATHCIDLMLEDLGKLSWIKKNYRAKNKCMQIHI